jgi:hypothetical protein
MDRRFDLSAKRSFKHNKTPLSMKKALFPPLSLVSQQGEAGKKRLQWWGSFASL